MPELRQFGDLETEDFERHPVWIGCHTADYGKSWYSQTDEETFRPWTGKLPVDPADGMFLVRAVIELRDGSRFPGFVTPAIGEPGSAPEEGTHLLGTQQPHIFVGDRMFRFWGGMIGIDAQQALYVTLGKCPQALFPLRFATVPGLTTGLASGQVNGFYQSSRAGIQVALAERSDDKEDEIAKWFLVGGRAHRGYPQPEKNFEFLKLVYAGACFRCGMFDRQTGPFRLKKSGNSSPYGFTQLLWVNDSFFAPPNIAEEISKASITGVVFRPAVYHRGGVELSDRVQLVFTTTVSCAETSRLPPVTCRPENEEVLSLRAHFAKQELLPETPGKSVLSPETQEALRKKRERIAALPYCGRVKHHPPTSLALIPDNLKSAPDLFQTAEWFGSGGWAYRMTLASERFVNLVREHRWKGLSFDRVKLNGFSERSI